jgi:poly-beta-hydroxybutyrate-responsive repressor
MPNDPDRPPTDGRDSSTAFRLHGDLLASSLLALLRVSNEYGYHLSQLLSDSGLPESDNGTVYRTLRQLERSGMVSSFWDTSASGPARRMYSLTTAGELFLRGWFDVMEKHQTLVREALDRSRSRTSASQGDAEATEDRTEEGTNADG